MSDILATSIQEDEGVRLLLGDIITIIAPQNELLNDRSFYIKYVDEYKISLIDIENASSSTLHVDDNGSIDDNSITEIQLVYRQEELGFSRQNGLLPKTWINIMFGGDTPSIVIAEVTNLEGDMIEITTYPDNKVFYIPFNYKGIPENMPIEKIEIRKPPEELEEQQNDDLQAQQWAEKRLEEGQEGLEGEEEMSYDNMPDDDEFHQFEPEGYSRIASSLHERELRASIISADKIILGDIHEAVTQFVDISDQFKRYSIHTQTDDLLESILSTIPTKDRTNSVMADISTQIDRFKQLREEYSEFDKNGVVKSIIVRSHLYKPLQQKLKTGENDLYWLLFTVKNTPKFYYVKGASSATSATYVDDPLLTYAMNDNRFIELGDDLEGMLTAIEDITTGASDQNKYIETYNAVNPYFTPFNEENPSTNDNDVIVQLDVKNDMNVVVNNEGNFKTNVISKNELDYKRFYMMKYNTGLTRLEQAPMSKMTLNSRVVNLTPPDKLAITSIMMLPVPVIFFSKVNLPGTNILERTNLNAHYLNYWKLLTKKLSVKTTYVPTNQTVEELDLEEKEKEKKERERNKKDNEDKMRAKSEGVKFVKSESPYEHFFETVTDYAQKKIDSVTVAGAGPGAQQKYEKYERFLDKIIPTTKELFHIMSKHITGKVSLLHVVNVLEPFSIYSKHLTYSQYRLMINFIDCKITKYYRTLQLLLRQFNKIKRLLPKTTALSPEGKTIYDMTGSSVDPGMKTQLFSNYEYIPEELVRPMSNSELLKRMLTDDFANVYNMAISISTLKLSYSPGLGPLLNSSKEEFKKMILEDQDKNNCSNYTLSKKYNTLVELFDDNGVEIYYDKVFDKTPYALMDNYEKEQRKMPKNEFFEFLVAKLMKKYKYDDENAAALAETLIDGVKKVKDGDHAVFFNTMTNKFDYFVRQTNKWVADPNVPANAFSSDPNILCNIQPNCLYAETQVNALCENVDIAKGVANDSTMSSILGQFDEKYNKNNEERAKEFESLLNYYMTVNEKLREIKVTRKMKYNNLFYELGLSLAESPEIVVSPFEKLKNIILSQSDVVERHSNVIRFAELCTRDAHESTEDSHWLYCLKTDVKLLPVFVRTLAQTFITNNANYDEVLQKIIKDIGVLSDDGDKIVDKYSGMEIDIIQFSTAEGHDVDGYKVVSRGAVEADWGDEVTEIELKDNDKVNAKDKPILQAKEVVMTPETKMIYMIVSAISATMGIHIPKQMEFIVRNVKNMLLELLYSEEEHELKNEALLKKGKPITSYEDHKGGILLYLTLGMFIIAVQTNIPSIKTRKTYPGCNSSLAGYPMGDVSDLQFVNYLACVSHKTRIASGPWKVLMKKKEDYIATAIFSYIDQYLLKTSEVSQKIKDKHLYLHTLAKEGVTMEIEDIFGMEHLDTFLPPLKPFTIKHLNGVPISFEESLLANLKTGSYKQHEQILVLQSKIISFSLALQEEIQSVIDSVVTKSLKKNNSYDLLINYGSQLALENACCNDDPNNNTRLYFSSKSDKIENYNKVVHSYYQILMDIKYQTTARQFFSIVNTKNAYPQAGLLFNKTTIYKAFMTYCNFTSKKQIPESLRHLCNEKPLSVRKNDSIKDIVKKMEDEGKTFTNEAMTELLLVVSKKNVVGTNMPSVAATQMQKMRELFEYMQEINSVKINKIFPEPLQKLVLGVLDTFDISKREETNELRELRNYVLGANKNMKKTIVTFISKHGSLSKDRVVELSGFLNTLVNWGDNNSIPRKKLSISDSDLYNSVNFIKTYLLNCIKIFPNIILTNKSDKYGKQFKLPKHWGVSEYDTVQIKSNIIDYYNSLNAFQDVAILVEPLSRIKQQLDILLKVADVTPCMSNISDSMQEDEVFGIFDKDTSFYLFEYYFLTTLTSYIDESSIVVKPKRQKARESLTDAVYSADKNDSVENFEDVQREEFNEQISEGRKKQIKTSVSNLICAYLDIMLGHKLTVNVSYDYIMENVFKIQRAETKTFTDRLENLKDDERESDSMLKTLKLGQWNKGLQKSLTTYNKNNDDDDAIRNNENYRKIENAVLKKRTVGAAGLDEAVEDFMNEMAADDMENIELGMGGIGEDFYDGDPYGDEYGDQ